MGKLAGLFNTLQAFDYDDLDEENIIKSLK